MRRTNSRSRLFFRKEKKGLGRKLIITLNLCDLLICLASTGSVVTFNEKIRSKENLTKYIDVITDDNFSGTIEKSMIEALKKHVLLSKTIRIAFSVPFQFLVQNSCFLTVLVSATRMVAMTKPLYIIRKKRVWASLLITSIFLFGLMIGKWVGLYFMYDIDVSSKTIKTIAEALRSRGSVHIVDNVHLWKYLTYAQIAEFFLVTLMVFVVVIFSGITVKSLSSPIVEVMEPGGVNNNVQNRRATIMVLLLSLAFVLTNGTWIFAFSRMYIDFLNRLKVTDRSETMTFVTLAIMLLNSVINPLIYIARNSELRRYTKQLFINILVGFMLIFSNLRAFLSDLIISWRDRVFF